MANQGGNAFLFDSFVDEGVRAFFVSASDSISLQPIVAGSYEELTTTTYTFNNGISFYVGLYTGNDYAVNGVYPNPLFGWAQLVNLNGEIHLLDSALEYGGAGIYAGTQTIIPVPEPGMLALFSVGGAVLFFSRFKRGIRKT